MTIKIRNDEYKLRSVVLSEINNLVSNSNIVIGSSTILIDYESNDPIFKNDVIGTLLFDKWNRYGWKYFLSEFLYKFVILVIFIYYSVVSFP